MKVSDKKSALVICYSAVTNDARVSNQIRWLEAAGYRVDILSQGPRHSDATGKGFRIGCQPLIVRVLAHTFLTPRARFRWLIGKKFPAEQLSGQKYDIVLVNDHHLLPQVVEVVSELAAGPVILDLHELYSGNGTGFIYKTLISRYDNWLLTFISSPVFSKWLTVAEGIADIYRDEYGLPRPHVIRNVAPFEQLEPSPVDPERIMLVHHGLASAERGIDIMLDASLLLEPRFSLVLMLVGDEHALASLRRHPAIAAGRAEFKPAVPVTEVARTLNQYDLELIFFPPRFPNNKHALPNKFFESVQGRLGVVIGESPEIVGLVRDNDLGIVVDGWTAPDLAAAINALDADDITALKQGSARAAKELSTSGEGPRFIREIGA